MDKTSNSVVLGLMGEMEIADGAYIYLLWKGRALTSGVKPLADWIAVQVLSDESDSWSDETE